MRDPRYLVVLGACLTQFTVIGMLFSYGVFFKAFETEFGWSRTLLSSCLALAFFVMGVLAIFSGQLNDRFGPRRVLGITGILYGLGFALLSRVDAPWQLFAVFGTFLALGLSTHDIATLSTIARWFEKRRGLMSGVVKVGTAGGQIAVPLVAAGLIAWLGWQDALAAMGIGAAVLLLAAAMLIRRPPETASIINAPGKSAGASFKEARRSRVFWIICAMQFLFFPTLITVPLHLAIHGMDLGLAQGSAAALLSIIGAASIAGRLAIGALSDRIGGRNAYAVCLLFLIVSLCAYAGTANAESLYLITAIYGFGHGGLFVVVSPTVAAYFGMRAHGAIFGTVVFCGTIGGSVGPIAAGFAFDQLGAYTPAFLALAAGAVFALLLARSLPKLTRPEFFEDYPLG